METGGIQAFDEVKDVVGAATYCSLALQGKTMFI
jgi:hypothetical protein